MSIAIGGFIGQGDPLTLIDHLKTMDVRDLTVYENDAGYRERGTVELVKQGKVRKIVASHIGTTPEIGKAMNEGRLEVEATPQGTLAEMMRCGGAGLGGFSRPPALVRSPKRASRSSSSTAASTFWCRRSSATSPSCALTRATPGAT